MAGRKGILQYTRSQYVKLVYFAVYKKEHNCITALYLHFHNILNEIPAYGRKFFGH